MNQTPLTTSLDNAEDDGLRLTITTTGDEITLSQVMPHLTLLGVEVTDERREQRGERMVYDFGINAPGASAWEPEQRRRFTDAFEASFRGDVDDDRLNELVVSARLTWEEVSWLRAIARYLQQGGVAYSQGYIKDALRANPEFAATLVAIFRTKFDPAGPADLAERRAQVDALVGEFTDALADVDSLDHDTILRLFRDVLTAAIRTNAFQADKPALAMKLRPRELEFLPEPRPMFEIFVFSPRVEGVHLRFGMVARGGLRWSDRGDDFRTEILGLVKAQMVKNTVIVPVGAKGGFYPKRLPNPAQDRQAWLDEGIACYQTFIRSLLSVTDNIVDGAIVPPADVVRFDDDDPYLVVAADKGTATFSDIANAISLEKGHWLGDAFASGGSVGYDHKGMGITAKGAWESVKRHFRELGVDCQSEDFTCVGIGDMAGDVFGNGMMLSEHIRLVAAFNHMHIFLDPNPDAATSFAERVRLFNLPRSTWEDYNPELISAGGGVYSRQLKSIPVSPEVREALGIDAEVTEMAPTALMNAIVKAPVDLLWNGGIGTYIKAESETHADAGDKANDAVRVNGADLRCKIVGEGGNLGATQLGRIEYARKGGKVNTDFIDNSAGVDTSDHEVNLKILFASEIAAGRLTMAERDELIPTLTDEIERLVLSHNMSQNRCLQASNTQSEMFAQIHENWMEILENEGYLNRAVEFMPSAEAMAQLVARGGSLTNPELCTLLAWTKIKLEDDVLASNLPDDEYLVQTLLDYFPAALHERFAEGINDHRLKREIVTTEVVNTFVDTQGISAYHRIAAESGAGVAEIIRAQIAARAILQGVEFTEALRTHPLVSGETSIRLRMEMRKAVERATRWLLANRATPINIQAAIDDYAGAIDRLRQTEGIVTGDSREQYQDKVDAFVEAGVLPEVAEAAAQASYLADALGVAEIARTTGRDLATAARVFFALGDRLHLHPMMERVQALPQSNRWDAMSRSALRDDLTEVRSQLTAEALAAKPGTEDEAEVISAWEAQGREVESKKATLAEIVSAPPSLSRMMVGMRILRSMLGSNA